MKPLLAAINRLENVALMGAMQSEIHLLGIDASQHTDDLRALIAALREFEKPKPLRLTMPPTPQDVAIYSALIAYPLNGQAWCDFYAAKGWMVGKTKMKDWQAAVRNWKVNGWGAGTIALRVSTAGIAAKDYSKF